MLWLAHAVTLARIPLAIAIVLASGHRSFAIGAIAAAAVSDAIDGNLARFLKRRGHTTPDIGGWLDPLADKIFVALVLVAIARTCGLAIVALIGARELLFVPLAALYLARRGARREPLHADAIGKLATIAQFVAMVVALAAPPASSWPLAAAIATGALGVAAVVHYVRALALAPALNASA